MEQRLIQYKYISYLLKIGFTPTKIADSFAIASGGAAFYRNRINTYKKKGRIENRIKKKKNTTTEHEKNS